MLHAVYFLNCLLNGTSWLGCYLADQVILRLVLPDKPDLQDLQYFLEFQVPLQWAPMFNELVLGPQKRKGSYPSMQFRFLGPKLHVSTSQVSAMLLCISDLKVSLWLIFYSSLLIKLKNFIWGITIFLAKEFLLFSDVTVSIYWHACFYSLLFHSRYLVLRNP